jgi:uncharacterized protein YgbK (DUF1537 family)
MKTAPQIAALVLADDATGALETGARLAERGLDVRVRFTADGAGGGLLVLDTETRHHSPDEARACIRAIAAAAKRCGVTRIFKKTDSTLRGPIAGEFRGLLDVWPELPIVYAPAYPALRRTVRDGVLYVDGRALDQIPAFFADTGAAVATVRSGVELQGALAGGRILVCDGESDTDLADVADKMRETPCIVAGPAVVASAWASALFDTLPRAWRPTAGTHTGLVVNGSLHPASREQLVASGILMLAHDIGREPRELGECLADMMAQERWAALCASPPCAAEPLAVARHAACVVAETVRRAAPDCLVGFGGDTVFAVLREMGIDEAEPHAELLPGVPASTVMAPGGPLLLITKAGAFGGPDYLLQIRKILEEA